MWFGSRREKNNFEKPNWLSLLVNNRFVLIHLAVWLGLYLLLGFFQWLRHMPDNGNVSWFDAGWYRSIRDLGYVYYPDKQSNVAFFPLFPLIWRFLHLNNIRMGLVNWFICLFSMLLLKRSLRLQNREALLFLSLPSMLFMYLPYTEATFLLCCTLLIVGMYENKWYLLLCGLFLSSLVRPTAMFYIPALIFSLLAVNRLRAEPWGPAIKKVLTCCGVSLAALLLVASVQRYQTGEWFLFFKVQGQFWNHRFNWPQLPFTTWSEARMLWIDAIALVFGIMAILFCCVWLFRCFQKNPNPAKIPPTIVLFSAAFLSLSTFSVVFFDSRDSPEGTTLMSLNRYIIASPFFIVFLWHLLKPGEFFAEYLLLTAVAITVMVICVYPTEGQFEDLKYRMIKNNTTWLYLGMIAVYVLSYLVMKLKEVRPDLMAGMYVVNMVMQLYLLNEFLVKNWVG